MRRAGGRRRSPVGSWGSEPESEAIDGRHDGDEGKQGQGELVVTLSDFGEPVSVTPPPASETTDAKALMSSFKSNFFKRG